MILKVARLLLVTLYIFSLESILLTHGLVPVLLWTREPTTLVNPLQKTSKSEFIDILSQSLQREQSPILVFLKDNFCTEDVNHHKKELQVLNKSGSLTYLTAVESALSIFSNLSSYNVSTEDEIESIAEGQLAIVPISDLSAVPEIYNVVQESSNNLIVAITGNSCSYSSLQRAKREVEDEDTGFLIDSERVLLYADRPPLMKFENSKEYKLIGKPTNTSSFDIGDSIFLSMQFDGEEIKEEPFTLRLRFEKLIGYYKLHGISYELDSGKAETFLRSKNSIQFPHNASYHCGQNSLFYYKVKHSKKEVLLIFENLQVQIDTRIFGDVYDCVGFTSIPIWSGVFVTGILASIMIWALTMIFEIKTMDRFDDTKGKCISINAQE